MSKKRFAPKFKIKKGDEVIVIAGNDKGSKGRVLDVLRKKDRVIVEGVKIVKRHTKPTQDDQGGIKEKEASIHISNVMLINASGEPTRIGRKLEDGKIVRYSKKTGEIIK